MNNKSYYLSLARSRYECAMLWRKAGQLRFEAMDMTDVRHYLSVANKLDSTCVKLP